LNTNAIKQQARSLGFDVCGIAPAAALPELQYLPEWLARGYAGEMVYLHKSAERRADIRNFLPSAHSVVVTGTLYNTDESGVGSRETGVGSDQLAVARYARGDDYHVVLQERLYALLDWMRGQHHDPFEAEIFVDKHHVQERVYARHAGIGWIGKNSCVINPELGSYLFLGGIAVSLALEPDAPSADQCGSCTQCLDACPTGALVDPHVLDATRCISYLTIEVPDSIPEARRPWIGSHAYGCDICQEVCPWNLAAPRTADGAWRAVARDGVGASQLWERSDDELHQWVKGSAMTYVPLSRFRRNLAIVIGNSGDPLLLPVLDRPGHGVNNAARSAQTPVVTEAVAWARARLTSDA
jgi:epoxyqueuosine reductase